MSVMRCVYLSISRLEMEAGFEKDMFDVSQIIFLTKLRSYPSSSAISIQIRGSKSTVQMWNSQFELRWEVSNFYGSHFTSALDLIRQK